MWKAASASPESTTVKPGITFPIAIEASGMTAEHLLPGITFEGALEWNGADRSYSLTKLAFNAPNSIGIGALMLRKLPISELRETIIRAAMPSEYANAYGRKAREDYAALVTGKLNDELLQEVGVRAAVSQGLYGNPNREVMECFDVPQRTASHWIARARAQGFLD